MVEKGIWGRGKRRNRRGEQDLQIYRVCARPPPYGVGRGYQGGVPFLTNKTSTQLSLDIEHVRVWGWSAARGP